MHKCTHSSWHHTTLPHHRLLFLCNFSSFVSLSPSLCGAPLLHCSIFLKSLRTSIVSSCSKSSHRGSSVRDFFFLLFSFFLSLSLSFFSRKIILSIHTPSLSNPGYVIIALTQQHDVSNRLQTWENHKHKQ
ncbi:hypothetical protein J3E69DRAFT_37222 [Trichoderma sp. SZMC 28015]